MQCGRCVKLPTKYDMNGLSAAGFFGGRNSRGEVPLAGPQAGTCLETMFDSVETLLFSPGNRVKRQAILRLEAIETCTSRC